MPQFVFILEGNLTTDPTLRHTDSGKAVCNIRILHNPRRRDRDDKWVNRPTIALSATCWGELAERVAKLRKGDTVIIDCMDDLRIETFGERSTMWASARNVSVSMRFAGASSHRARRAPDPAFVTADSVGTPDDEYVPEELAVA